MDFVSFRFKNSLFLSDWRVEQRNLFTKNMLTPSALLLSLSLSPFFWMYEIFIIFFSFTFRSHVLLPIFSVVALSFCCRLSTVKWGLKNENFDFSLIFVVVHVFGLMLFDSMLDDNILRAVCCWYQSRLLYTQHTDTHRHSLSINNSQSFTSKTNGKSRKKREN